VAGPEVSRQSASETDLFDRAEALSRVDGDTELMCSLVHIFFTQAGPMMEAIRAAVVSHDPVQLEKAAHRLKGSISIFGSHLVWQTALELEQIGQTGDFTKAGETLDQLEQHMTNLQPVLKQFHRELQTSS